MIPGTIAQPRTPFVVAANGPRTMALAARYGQGWATYGPAYATEDVPDEPAAAQEQWWTGLATMLEQVDQIESAHRPAGQPPLRRYLSLDGAPIFSMTSLDLVTEGVERAAALGFTDVVVHWPRADGIYAGDESVLEGLVDHLPRLQAL